MNHPNCKRAILVFCSINNFRYYINLKKYSDIYGVQKKEIK